MHEKKKRKMHVFLKSLQTPRFYDSTATPNTRCRVLGLHSRTSPPCTSNTIMTSRHLCKQMTQSGLQRRESYKRPSTHRAHGHTTASISSRANSTDRPTAGRLVSSINFGRQRFHFLGGKKKPNRKWDDDEGRVRRWHENKSRR